MRHVFLPDNLTAIELLDFRECNSVYRGILQGEILSLAKQGDYSGALIALDMVINEDTTPRIDPMIVALASVLRSEIYRRQHRWEEAIRLIQSALNILELQVTSIARYNEGVAVYTEGLCHICTQAIDRVTETFSYAHDVFRESQHYWRFMRIPEREYSCQDVVSVMMGLLRAHKHVGDGFSAVFLAVYEQREHKFMRVDVIGLQPDQYAAAIEASPKGSSGIVLLNPEGISGSALNMSATYIGVRITETGKKHDVGKVGDLMILEVSRVEMQIVQTAAALPDWSAPATLPVFLDAFTRTHDGRVVYNAQMIRLAGCDWLVIPHLLIRKEVLL